MLAYVAWHRPAAGVQKAGYERALERFHRSLARVPPSGFGGSQSFRITTHSWLEGSVGAGIAAYEDWYLVDSWSALGVLEEAAVAHGHRTRHDAAAQLSGALSAGVYRLSDGHPRLQAARVGVWVQPAPGHVPPTLADLLADGMDPQASGLWRRCLVLGPAPEYCVLSPEPPAGVAPTRLPPGWHSAVDEREALWPS